MSPYQVVRVRVLVQQERGLFPPAAVDVADEARRQLRDHAPQLAVTHAAAEPPAGGREEEVLAGGGVFDSEGHVLEDVVPRGVAPGRREGGEGGARARGGVVKRGTVGQPVNLRRRRVQQRRRGGIGEDLDPNWR